MREVVLDKGCKIRIKQSQQVKVLLGSYTKQETIKGFTVETTTQNDDSVSTKIVHVDDLGGYKLFMNITNFGDKPISATIQKIENI